MYVEGLTLRQTDRTAWVFGAGASAGSPYDIPVQTKLLSRFATMTRPGGPRLQAEFAALKSRVGDHCRRVQPGLDMANPDLSLEEVFSAYELALSEPRSTRVERAEAESAIRNLRDALRLATFVYGRGDARKWRPFSRQGQPSPYAELLEALYAPPVGRSGTHALITFNYDICLDRCVINLRRSPCKLELDYGIALANHRHPGAPNFDPAPPEGGVLVLRTHGALNLLRCAACESVFTSVNTYATVAEASKCWACGRACLDYVLVHPSYLRSYRDPAIRLVWGRCLEELVRAGRWVFVGYSLPAADVHFRELLRDAMRQRDARREKTEVLLVSRGPTSGDSFRQLESNYRVLFPDRLAVWNATSAGFGGFVKSIELE